MLPTEDATFLVDGATDGIFYITEGPDKSKLKGDTNVHLYILSDDDIKEGDWCYSKWDKKLYKAALNGPKDGPSDDTIKKIIATTDPKLNRYIENNSCKNKNCHGGVITYNGATGIACKKCNKEKRLPQAPQSLVEYYAKHKPEQVELEYEIGSCKIDIDGMIKTVPTKPKLKLQHNKVVWVKPEIEKFKNAYNKANNLYTREEVEELFLQFREEHLYIFDMTNEEYIKQWLKENL